MTPGARPGAPGFALPDVLHVGAEAHGERSGGISTLRESVSVAQRSYSGAERHGVIGRADQLCLEALPVHPPYRLLNLSPLRPSAPSHRTPVGGCLSRQEQAELVNARPRRRRECFLGAGTTEELRARSTQAGVLSKPSTGLQS